jgi:type II secretory pathway predicted ATPase ExeA
MTTSHLHAETVKLLALPDRERVRAIIKGRWIPYPRAQYALERLEELVDYPTSHRMPNLLVVGDTNNGKTLMLKRFANAHGAFERESDNQRIWPVLFIQAPPEPDERQFYNVILERVGMPYRMNDRVDKKQQQVIHILRQLEVRVLVIDEIHHILAGNQNKQRLFLNVLKYLSNELMIPLVCAGIRTAFNAIQQDEQLANRFEPVVLPPWTLGKEYLRLLLSFEQLLPLRNASNLAADDIAHKILSMAEGKLGEISKVLRLAAVAAIHSKRECITLSLLSKSGYVVPSDRMKYHKHLKPIE